MTPASRSAMPVSPDAHGQLMRAVAKGKRLRAPHVDIRRKRVKVRVGDGRTPLQQYQKSIEEHGKQFPNLIRLAQQSSDQPPLSHTCNCDGCAGRKQGWPVGYIWTMRGKGFGDSYECALHQQSDDFLSQLPHSSSIVRFG
jgi:hypothetical protein